MRLMNGLWLDLPGVGFSHGWPSIGSLATPHALSSAPFGGLKTTMSPRDGSCDLYASRFTVTISPIRIVGSIAPLGTR